MQLDSLYQDIILDHYKHPRRRGLREPFDAEVHHVNPTCGDEVTLRVHLTHAGDSVVLDDVSYDGEGCSISQASTSVLAEQLTGRPVEECLETSQRFLELLQSKGETGGDDLESLGDVLGDGVAFAGVSRYPARVKCALLGWKALEAALTEADLMADVLPTSTHREQS
ncbi:MAG: Fe-S cluster assembly sulfur transfer protein SufU [Actinomycetales bacterium]